MGRLIVYVKEDRDQYLTLNGNIKKSELVVEITNNFKVNQHILRSP